MQNSWLIAFRKTYTVRFSRHGPFPSNNKPHITNRPFPRRDRKSLTPLEAPKSSFAAHSVTATTCSRQSNSSGVKWWRHAHLLLDVAARLRSKKQQYMSIIISLESRETVWCSNRMQNSCWTFCAILFLCRIAFLRPNINLWNFMFMNV